MRGHVESVPRRAGRTRPYSSTSQAKLPIVRAEACERRLPPPRQPKLRSRSCLLEPKRIAADRRRTRDTGATAHGVLPSWRPNFPYQPACRGVRVRRGAHGYATSYCRNGTLAIWRSDRESQTVSDWWHDRGAHLTDNLVLEDDSGSVPQSTGSGRLTHYAARQDVGASRSSTSTERLSRWIWSSDPCRGSCGKACP
jgi:hypothetical protein